MVAAALVLVFIAGFYVGAHHVGAPLRRLDIRPAQRRHP